MTKVTAFYDPGGSIYAFSENETYVVLFETQRRLRGFYKKTLHLSKMQYKSLLYFHSNKLLFENILTDGKETYLFITTYEEESRLSFMCERIWDHFYDMERLLLNFPLNTRIQELLKIIREARREKEDSFGKFNTFNIFIKLFKESIL